jgi:hypothetical protein
MMQPDVGGRLLLRTRRTLMAGAAPRVRRDFQRDFQQRERAAFDSSSFSLSPHQRVSTVTRWRTQYQMQRTIGTRKRIARLGFLATCLQQWRRRRGEVASG